MLILVLAVDDENLGDSGVDEKSTKTLRNSGVNVPVRALVNSARIVTSFNAEIALLTPVCAPGVAHNVVINVVLSAIADKEDTVVELGTAGGASDDTGGVELEGRTGSGNADRDGLLGGGGNESGLVVVNHVVAGDEGTVDVGLALLGLAGAVAGGVGTVVVGLVDAVLLVVREGAIHEATVATLVALGTGAVNKLLLGELHEAVLGKTVSTLHGADGGESPAGTALALVLDGTNNVGVLAPVNGSRNLASELGGLGSLGTERSTGRLHGVASSELLSREVSELSDTHGESLGGVGVVSEDDVEVVLESVVLGEELLGLILGIVLGDELSEEELSLGLREGSGSNSGRGSNKKSSLHDS